jgi:hypothetical protein
MRRVVVFVVGLLVLQATPAGAGAPDVVRQRMCSDGAGSRLELTDIGRTPDQYRIRMRFEVHRSPVGHSWRITLRANRLGFLSPNPVIRRTTVASDSGDLAVQVRRWGVDGRVEARAVDTQTGQRCFVRARLQA